MTDVTYKTHFLLGVGGDASVARAVERWEYPPSGKELAEAIAKHETHHEVFVLVAPVGPVLPGKWEHPVDYGCCG